MYCLHLLLAYRVIPFLSTLGFPHVLCFNTSMNILAIETSCDETAASVISSKNDVLDVRSTIISSQVELHAKWGGVVPNLAAREHTKNILPVLTEALDTANTSPDDIDLIAVTQGPGLIPALLIGTNAAKALAYAWEKPLLGLHHIEGHIYANFIRRNTNESNEPPLAFPILALVVSGGHTQLVLMKEHCHYEIIGETQDDAVGEAFDKAARLLGLPYPGGPAISAEAEKYGKRITKNETDNSKKSNAYDLKLPRPMLHSGNYNFSFSGIKTAVLYAVREFQKENGLSKDDSLPEDFVQEVAHEFQEAVTEVLISKTIKAAREYGAQTILLAGGVSANTQLREELATAIANDLPSVSFSLPSLQHCLDNAAMIAAAAAFRWNKMTDAQKEESKNGYKTVLADSNLKMTSLNSSK